MLRQTKPSILRATLLKSERNLHCAREDGRVAAVNNAFTRREVLSGLGVTVAVAGLCIFPREARAEVREVLMSYEDGLELLRKEVFNNPYEFGAAFYHNEKGSPTWRLYPGVSRTSFGFPSGEIKGLLADINITGQIQLLHTHPLTTIIDKNVDLDTNEKIEDHEHAEARLKRVRDGTEAPPLMYPSIDDIRFAIRTRIDTGLESEERIKHAVADPQGIWDYEVDFGHSFIKLILSRIAESYRLGQDSVSDVELMKDLRLHADNETSLIGSGALFELVLFRKTFYRYFDYRTEAKRHEIITLFKKIGVTLTYTRHAGNWWE